jgi:hypothetical protein
VSAQEEITILTKRRIEAEIIKPVYEILCLELGEKMAAKIIGQAIKIAAIEDGKKLAALEKGPVGLLSFASIQHLWKKGGALTTTTLTENEKQFDYNVTYCAYAEMYRQMGLAELGFILSCNRDEAFIKGYAPGIKMVRTQTIMNGAPYCDFRYKVEK